MADELTRTLGKEMTEAWDKALTGAYDKGVKTSLRAMATAIRQLRALDLPPDKILEGVEYIVAHADEVPELVRAKQEEISRG